MTDQTKLGQFDKTIRNCKVADIPAGSLPKFISVRLPGTDGSLVDAWWTGSPKLAVNDYCKLLRQPDTPQYEVVGTSGGTAALPATHTHGADEITVDTAGFTGNLSAADDTVQKALDTLDDMAGGGGGWPFDQVLTVSSSNANADHATIADAITAAGSSDGILLDGETFTETVTLNKFAYLKGYDRGVSIINGKVTSSAGAILEKVAISVTSAEAIEITTSRGTLRQCRIVATTGSGLKGIYDRRGCDLYDTTSEANGGSGNQYALYCSPSTSQTTNVYGGLYRGATADIYADTNATINLFGPVLYNASNTNYPIAGTGTVKGYYYDLSGNLYFVRAQSGLQGKVWRHRADNIRVQEADLATAISNASTGDKIKLFPGTYTLGSSLSLNKAVEVEGDGVGVTIITGSVSNSPTVDVAADNVTFKNLTIQHTGTGSVAGPLSTDNANLILDNVFLDKTSGASTTSYGLWMYGGSVTFKNGSRISCTAGTTKYGIMNDTANTTITIYGGQIGGDTADIYTARSGSSLIVNDPILTSAIVDWAGTKRGSALDSYGRRLRFKPAGITDGRLTLTSGTPVTTADVTAATSIYYTPYTGGACEVFNGYVWIEAPFIELSLSLSGFTANKNSDVWIYDNAGTLALERTEWTNDTTRATAIAYQDGRYVKSGTTTRLYVGTFRTTGTTGQTEDSLARRLVWNNYNRRARQIYQYNYDTHTYGTATWRVFANNTAYKVDFVAGVAEDFIKGACHFGIRMPSASGPFRVAFSLNSTTAIQGVGMYLANGSGGSQLTFAYFPYSVSFTPGVGYNYMHPMEKTDSTPSPNYDDYYFDFLING